MWTVHWKKNKQKKQKKRATKGVGSFEPVLHAWCSRLIMKISSSPASRSKETTFSPLFVVRSIFSSSVRLSVPNRQLQFIQFNYYSSSFLFCFGDYKIVTSPCVIIVKCWMYNMWEISVPERYGQTIENVRKRNRTGWVLSEYPLYYSLD